MSDFDAPVTPAAEPAPSTDTAVSAPVSSSAPSAEPAAAAAPTEDALHPAWARTFDEAGIPDMLRPKLIEQVRRTEAEYNKGIEKARGEALPAEWRGFLDQAQQSGASPDDLIMSWNAAQAIREDPIKFLDSFSAQVDAAVKAGHLTRAEGQQAKVDAADAAGDTVTLGSPEAAEIAQLRAQIEQITGAQAAREQAEAAAAAQQQADVWAQQFVGTLTERLATAGFADASGQVNPAALQAVGAIADSLLAADTTGRLTDEAAINAAVQQALTLSGRTAPASAPQIPVHGGGAALPAPGAKKFASEAEREQAMLEVAKQFQNQ